MYMYMYLISISTVHMLKEDLSQYSIVLYWDINIDVFNSVDVFQGVRYYVELYMFNVKSIVVHQMCCSKNSPHNNTVILHNHSFDNTMLKYCTSLYCVVQYRVGTALYGEFYCVWLLFVVM